MLKVPSAVKSCINEDLQFLEEMVVMKWEGLQTEIAYRLPVPPFANMGQL